MAKIKTVNYSLFLLPAAFLSVVVLCGAFDFENFSRVVTGALNFTLKYFSWFYSLTAVFLLFFCAWAAFGKYGKIRLGGAGAEPEISRATWFTVTFASVLALGILYYGAAEPMLHYLSPPDFLNIAPQSDQAVRVAFRFTFFHWTVAPFAIYGSAGVCCALMFYNTKRKFKVSSALYPLLGERADRWLGNLVDGLSIIAMVGGMATLLGFGLLQTGAALNRLWGLPTGPFTWGMIILIIMAVCVLSACTGIHEGMKYVSKLSMSLCFVLFFFIFLGGKTLAIIKNTITAVGDYIQHALPLMFELDPVRQSGWLEDWTMFYWAWWIAFAPITGLFMAKLAKGRTIREFIYMNVLMPSLMVFLWFGAFGTQAVFMDHFDGANIGALIEELGSQMALFALIEQYPLATAVSTLALITILTAFITKAEAFSLTLSIITTVGFDDSRKTPNPPRPITIFWAILMGGLTYILLLFDGLTGLQAAAVVLALPIVVLLVFMALSYIKAVKNLKEFDLVGQEEASIISPANSLEAEGPGPAKD